MKKTLCALLIACMLTTALACAEGSLFTSGATESKLEAMIPVLDSLALSLNVAVDDLDEDEPAPQLTYSAEDTALVWTQMKTLANDWVSRDPNYADVDAEEGVVVVPSEVMDAIVAASFQGLMIAPMQPDVEDDDEGMVYDEQEDVYVVSLEDTYDHYLVIERNAQDGETMVVNCSLYETETERRMGGLTARMTDAEPDAMYPYVVTDAHTERGDDFNGLWANYCDIRYTEPEVVEAEDEDEEPVVKAAPTATPKPASSSSSSRSSSSSTRSTSSSSSGTAYRRLADGSTGEDVKDLQNRLNKLGYDCGKADGIYGKATVAAVKYFQQAIGETQDGVASTALQKKLFSSSAPKYEEYIDLKRGDSGARVEDLQDRLRELGYTGHPKDGEYDSRIEDAVSLFQFTAGLEVTGKADIATQKAMNKKDAPECADLIDLEKDDSGSRVEEMQGRLVYLKYLEEVTGKYDAKTVDAVAAFKKDHNIEGTGKTAEAWVIGVMFGTTPSTDEKPQETPTPVEEVIENPETTPAEETTEPTTPATENTETTSPAAENAESTTPTTENTETTTPTTPVTENTETTTPTENTEPAAPATENAGSETETKPTAEETSTGEAETAPAATEESSSGGEAEAQPAATEESSSSSETESKPEAAEGSSSGSEAEAKPAAEEKTESEAESKPAEEKTEAEAAPAEEKASVEAEPAPAPVEEKVESAEPSTEE